MTTTASGEPIAATDREQRQLRELDAFYRSGAPADGCVRLVSAAGHEYELPESAARLLAEAVHALARGEAVSVVPIHKALTTQQAADLLNISRQYLVRMLDRGDIPFHKVGAHRRIAFDDLMSYKRRRERERQRGFAELAELSQQLGLYE